MGNETSAILKKSLRNKKTVFKTVLSSKWTETSWKLMVVGEGRAGKLQL